MGHSGLFKTALLALLGTTSLILHVAFAVSLPYELTDPDNIPDNQDEVYFPVPRTHMPAKKRYKLVQEALSNVTNIIKSNSSENDCTKCKNTLAAALHAPAF